MPVPASRYRVRTSDRVIGPHALETLQQMASLREFGEDAFISLAESENWTPLRDLPELHAVLFPPARKFQLKDKPFENVNATSSAAAPTIEEMLRENLARAQSAEGAVRFDDIRPSRRRRDYLIAAISGNALGVTALMLGLHNPVVLIFALSYFVLFNLTTYWVFYHIMDRY